MLRIAVLSIVFVVGCSPSPSPAPAPTVAIPPASNEAAAPSASASAETPRMPSKGHPLVATFSGPSRFSSSATASVKLTVRNTGTKDEVLEPFILGNVILSCDVVDGSGQRMLTVPPPVPPLSIDKYPLAPGAEATFDLSLHVFSPPLPKGNYTLKLRHDDAIESRPFTFAIE